MVGAHLPRDLQAVGQAVDTDYQTGARKLRTNGRAQAYRALREHRHRVTDAHAGGLCAAETGGHDVGAHQHLLVAQAVGHGRQVGHGIGHHNEFGLAAVDGVAQLPAAHRLPAMFSACAVL